MTHDEALDLAAALRPRARSSDAEEAAVREHLATCPESAPRVRGARRRRAVPARARRTSTWSSRRRRSATGSWPPPRPTSPREPRPSATTAGAGRRRTAPDRLPVGGPSATARAERTRSRPGPLTGSRRSRQSSRSSLLGAWNVRLQGQVNDLEQQATAAEQYRTAVTTVLDVAAQPGSQTALLAPQTSGGPRGIAVVSPRTARSSSRCRISRRRAAARSTRRG